MYNYRRPKTSALLCLIKSFLISLGVLLSLYYVKTLLHSQSFPSLHFTQNAPARPPPLAIPKKIWYVLGAQQPMDDAARQRIYTCVERNPAHDVQIVNADESSGEEIIRSAFADDRPDILGTYLALSAALPAAVRADLLRYVVLYDQGGLALDPAASCGDVPIERWVPERHRGRAGLVVGWELEARQLASWAVLARPRSPHVLAVIENTLEMLRYRTAQDGAIGDDVAGPGMLTVSVFDSLGRTLRGRMGRVSVERIAQSGPVGDVLIMPSYSFDLSTEQYADFRGVNNTGPVLLTEHYAVTWQNAGGEEELK
ncbi:hypothetical protein KJ359_000825 [Pestalotiopsis sp. 9143b]|nr:hypothetical protein KJ359_000825 [Pestalotiopsis sp. 9143b]